MPTWRELANHPGPLPDDRDLPCEDGKMAKSSQVAPQRDLLTGSLHAHWKDTPPFAGPYVIGSCPGIYWRLPEPPEPLIAGAVDPEWYLMPGASPCIGKRPRRSVVLWHEKAVPRVVIEFTLDDGLESWDATPGSGRSWIYEHAIGVEFYAICGMETGRLDCFRLEDGRYQPIVLNARGHFGVPSLPLELGIWQGRFQNYDLGWLRWWDDHGQMLPTYDEIAERRHAEADRYHAQAEHYLAQQERHRAEADRLRRCHPSRRAPPRPRHQPR